MADIEMGVEGVVLGFDTHADTHMCAVIDTRGRLQDTFEFAADLAGFKSMWAWVGGQGTIVAAGVEGTGDYGANLTCWLQKRSVLVLEVNRPNRQRRRRFGKSDTNDAISAARTVLAGEAFVIPKDRTGQVEAIRVLHMTRRSAVHNRTQAGNQIKDLVVTAPEPIREQLKDLNCRQRVKLAAKWRPGDPTDPTSATRHAIKTLALRWLALDTEIKTTERHIWPLLKGLVPRLLAEEGVGPDVAAKLVIAAGQNYDRLRTEGSFAALCGTSPVEASSGKTSRHRLNQGGNRQANNALHTVALYRIRAHPETLEYVARQQAKGKTQRDITRKLKRALARRFHHILHQELTQPLT